MRNTIIALLFTLFIASAAAADVPESVIATFCATRGSEAQLETVLAKHWETITRLQLVTEPERHAFRRRDDGGKTCYVEFLTWRSESIPDNAPPDVLAIWNEMHKLGTVKIEAVEPVK